MNKKILFLTALFIYLFCCNATYAYYKADLVNTNGDIPQDSLKKMTNDEYCAYIDSLYRTQLPQLQSVCFPDSLKAVKPPMRQKAQFSYSNSYVPNSVPISTTKAVGQIDIHSDVTPSGAKTYTVPIKGYKHDGVLCPDISLTYNSQAGGSSYGKGWGIGGLQSIARGNKTIYYDGKTEGIKMNANDVFYLNGTRLVNISGNTYETEQGNIKVVANVDGDVVKNFNVYYPNGYTAVFGMTTNTTNRLEYPITTLADTRGRTITFNYINNYNTYIISNIIYDNNTARISFTYNNTRADFVQGYRNGLLLDNHSLLRSISCTRSGAEIGTYTLSYITDPGTSLLDKIDFSAKGSSLNPLKFYYGDGSAIQGYYTDMANVFMGYSYNERSALNAVRGRFDYTSGNDGLIVYPNKVPYYHYSRDGSIGYHSLNHFRSMYNATDTAMIYTELIPSQPINIPAYLTVGVDFITVLTAALDGDQQESIIRVNNSVDGNYDALSFSVYVKSAVGIIKRYDTRTFNYPTVHIDNSNKKSVKPKCFYTGDFNGDGKMEVMAISADNPFGETNNPSTCYIYDLNNNTTLYTGNLLHLKMSFAGTETDPLTAGNNSDKLFPVDYNGDGKTDLIHINSSGVDFYEFSQNGSTWSAQKVATYTGITRVSLENRSVSVGDFNGDGLADLLVSPVMTSSGGTTWTFYFSKGDGSFAVSTSQGPNTMNTTSDFISQDIDGDGITDLVEIDDFNFTGYTVKNNGMTSGVSQSLLHDKSILVPVSLFSSSLSTQFISLYGYNAMLYSYKTNRRADQALTGMASSLGVVEKNYYYTLSNSNPGIYSYPTTTYATYPYCNMFEPITVVAGDEVFASNGTKNRYGYNNSIAHRQGLGFCGFESVTTIDKRNQESIVVYDPFNRGVLLNEYTPEASVTYTNSVTVDSYKRLKALVSSKSVNDHLKDISYSTSYSYDSYGQQLSENTTMPGNITVNKITNYSYFTNVGSKYYLCRPSTSTTIVTRGTSLHTEQTNYTSYNANDQPLTIVNKVNGNTVKTTTFTYDSNGNVTSRSEYPYASSTSQTTSYQWTTGNRMTMETSPIGVWKSYSYNTDGTVQKTNSAVGETSYTYDAFGRLIKEERPDGTETNTGFSWNTSNGGIYEITTSGTGIPTETTAYTAQNLKANSLLTRFDGSLLRTIRAYDGYGNLVAESYPYWNTTPVFRSYTYDTYNRVTRIVDGGKTTDISYIGLTKTTSDGTASSTTTTDALGGIVSVTDNAGTINYTLNGAGNPIAISAPSGSGSISTSIAYDGFERRTSISDPSHGTTTYTYHSTEGYLLKEKNARNQETTYEYDTYRRLSKKTSPEFYTSYTYNNNLNKVTAETSSNGTSSTYTYDGYGRLSSERENAVDGKWLQKDYTYNGGKVSAIQYTSQNGILTTENYYYANGYLTNVKLNGTTDIFQLDSEDNFGHATSVSTMGITRNYGFTPKGLPTSRSASYGSNTIQSLTYSFDSSTENLTSRYNGDNNRTESFTYDNLHRLTNYGGTAVEYDSNGNILTKGDVGSFEYNIAGKPYAVSDVTLSSSITVGAQDVSYCSFDRPSMITDNGYTANFTYNGRFDRVKMQLLHSSSPVLTRYYLGGCYELDVKPTGTTEKLYLDGGYYDAPVVLVKQGSSVANYNILRDHLGSITHVVNSSGSVMQELSYDAWGRLRNPSDYTLYSPTNEPEPYLGRGYCGHEHLTGLGLVNMNARLYDPLLGRFLSSDPYVQAPEHSQSFNRYSYCMNNPLIYKDENGEFFLELCLGLIGAYLGGAAMNRGELNPGHWNYKSIDTYLGIIGGGVLGGVAGYGIANSGSIIFNIGAFSPYGSANIGISGTAASIGSGASIAVGAGAGTKWKYNFHWTTSAGGSGSTDFSQRKIDKRASDAYDNAANNMRRTFYNGARSLYQGVSTSFGALSRYGASTTKDFANNFNKPYLRPIGREFDVIDIMLETTPERQLRKAVTNVGGYYGAEFFGGVVGGVFGAGVEYASSGIGTGAIPYFSTIGYGLGAYYGEPTGEFLSGFAFDIIYDTYMFKQFISRRTTPDASILLQYNSSSYNIYNFFTFY